MKYRTFGHTSTKVSVLGQGTWNMESLSNRDFSRVIHRGLELGMTHIDTAEMYGDGRVEVLLGKTMKKERDNLFLVSKVLPSNVSRKGTIQACERSLQRLKTEYLYCSLLHWLGPYPLEETFVPFEELQPFGKIRSWGMRNVYKHTLATARQLTSNRQIVCNQVPYHLQERTIEHAVLPFCSQYCRRGGGHLSARHAVYRSGHSDA
jgi:aryl-alcohol dehydrogenase-like predicted oxidoreductase